MYGEFVLQKKTAGRRFYLPVRSFYPLSSWQHQVYFALSFLLPTLENKIMKVFPGIDSTFLPLSPRYGGDGSGQPSARLVFSTLREAGSA